MEGDPLGRFRGDPSVLTTRHSCAPPLLAGMQQRRALLRCTLRRGGAQRDRDLAGKGHRGDRPTDRSRQTSRAPVELEVRAARFHPREIRERREAQRACACARGAKAALSRVRLDSRKRLRSLSPTGDLSAFFSISTRANGDVI